MVHTGRLVLAMVLGLAGAAVAQPTVDAESDGRAREIFVNGVALYQDGRYDLAIEAFMEAYRLSRRPDLLFNIANTYEQLGQIPEALDALQRYRVYARPDERDAIAERVRGWEQILADRRRPLLSEIGIEAEGVEDPEEVADTEEAGRGQEAGRDDEAERDEAGERDDEVDPFAARRTADSTARAGASASGPSPLGPVLAGGGGALAGAFGAVAGVTWNQAEQARAVGDQAGWEGVRPLNNASLALVAAGGLTAAAGIVVTVAEATRGRGDGSVAVVPSAGFDGDRVWLGVVGQWGAE